MSRGRDAAVRWVSHAEGPPASTSCWHLLLAPPARRHLLYLCQGVLLAWVLSLANQQLQSNIVNWEELWAREGHQCCPLTGGRAPATTPGATCGSGVSHASHCPLGHARKTWSPLKPQLLKLVPFCSGVGLRNRISLCLSSLWGKFLWLPVSCWEARNFLRSTVWDRDKGSLG